MNRCIMPVFRQKIGDVYHFDILSVLNYNGQTKSSIIGFCVFNFRTLQHFFQAPDFDFLDKCTTEDVIKMISEKIVPQLENVFQNLPTY